MPCCSHHYSIPMGEIKRQNTKITQMPHLLCISHWSSSLFAFDSSQNKWPNSTQYQHSYICSRLLRVGHDGSAWNLFLIYREEQFFNNSLLPRRYRHYVSQEASGRRVVGCDSVLLYTVLFLSLLSFAASSTVNLRKVKQFCLRSPGLLCCIILLVPENAWLLPRPLAPFYIHMA